MPVLPVFDTTQQTRGHEAHLLECGEELDDELLTAHGVLCSVIAQVGPAGKEVRV